MNAVVESAQRGMVATSDRMAVADVVQHAKTVQEVMKAVMKEGLHYGKIPGTDKPSLLQPGADVLAMTFRIAQKIATEDLSTPDAVRYRVTVSGVHQTTGIVLGEGIGECSSSEEKYKWRRAVNKAEFEATPENMRRVKYGRDYTANQVRTEPADVANTVLKMAVKRAKIAMILNVTGASDMFGQDLEDLDESLREALTEGERGGGGTMQADRDKWLAEVAACTTLEALGTLAAARGPAVAHFQRAKDTEGYAQFSAAVKARGAALRAAAPAPAPAAAADATAAAPAAAPADDAPPLDDDFVRQMDAAEKAGASDA